MIEVCLVCEHIVAREGGSLGMMFLKGENSPWNEPMLLTWRWRIIGRQTRYNKISPTVSFLSRQPIGGFSIGLSPKFLSNVTSWCMPLAVLSIGCPLIIVIVITPYPRPEIGMRFKFQVISARLSGVVSWEGQTKTVKFIYCRHSLNCLVFLCTERCPSRWVSVGSKLRFF